MLSWGLDKEQILSHMRNRIPDLRISRSDALPLSYKKKSYGVLGHKMTRVLQKIIITLQWSTYESSWCHQSASIQVDLVLWFGAVALQQLASSSK